MRVGQTTPLQAEHVFRLNPFSLPARFEANTAEPAAADASVYLDCKMAIVRRKIAGLPLNIKIPIKMYKGVAIQYDVTGNGAPSVEIFLVHQDPAMCLTLSRGNDNSDVSADWQAWGKLFGLPLLIRSETGDFETAKDYLGKLAISTSLDRRYHSQFADRRPRFLAKRRPGAKPAQKTVSGREIIARN